MLSAKLLSQFEQGFWFDDYAEDLEFFCKKMFGGLACYYRGLMVACLVEGQPGDTKWKGVDYGFPIWRGVLLPTDFPHHQSLQKLLSGVDPHPVLKKWLYVPWDSEDYDENMKKWLRLMAKGDPRVGILPGVRRHKKRKKTKSKRSKRTKTE